MASRGDKLAAWVAFGLVVVLAYGEVAVAKPATDCNWQDQVPKFEIDRLPMHTNKYNTALAKVAGYLTYTEKNSTVYLPLNVFSFGTYRTEFGHRLVASTDSKRCTILDFISVLDQQSTDKAEKVTNLIMEFYSPDGSPAHCYVQNPAGVAFTDKTHYSCEKSVTYPCYSYETKEPLADLVLVDFEFEFDSNPAMASQGQWTKEASTCA